MNGSFYKPAFNEGCGSLKPQFIAPNSKLMALDNAEPCGLWQKITI